MGQLIGLVVILGLIGLVIGFLLLAAIYIVPVVAVCAVAYWLARHPYWRVRQRYDTARARLGRVQAPADAAITEAILVRYFHALKDRHLPPPSRTVSAALCRVVDQLVEDEALGSRFVLPPPPGFQFAPRPNYWPLIADLERLEQSLDDDLTERFEGAVADMLVSFTEALPEAATCSWQAFESEADDRTAFLTIPAHDVMTRVGEVVTLISRAFLDDQVEALRLFGALRARYMKNAIAQSQEELTKTDFEAGKAVLAHESALETPAAIVAAYLGGTPWRAAFATPVPFSFEERRFQHQWVIAPTGSGKTQLLKAQIVADLPKVARGEASVVVLDSQGTKPGTLIGDLIRLKLFAPGGPLEGRLVFLDPDPAYPLALNLFDFGLAAMGEASERARRAHLTGVIDLAEFIINGLVGAEQTPMMTGISRYLIQALMVIPDATVETFRDLMAKGGIDKYRRYLDELDDYTRDFFDTRFAAPQYEATKAGIFWRLDTMMSDPSFREMFLNPRNKLDLAKELNAGKVIVVNTDRELLKAEGTEAFGRFILARLLLATQQRASEANPLPTYVFIDECQDYIADEDRIAEFIDKARKQKVGVVFAHQRLSNIRSANVADALANTAIQFAGGNKTDAGTLAGLLRAEPEFIENQPALSFVAYVKGQTQRGVQVTVPYGVMENMEKMSREEEAALRTDMRERYGATKRQRRSREPAEEVLAPTKWDE